VPRCPAEKIYAKTAELGRKVNTAPMIKRFRELQMPLNEIRQLLTSPDDSTRNAIMAAHLR
jgi:DNA-binding transcriptional MerR regulator